MDVEMVEVGGGHVNLWVTIGASVATGAVYECPNATRQSAAAKPGYYPWFAYWDSHGCILKRAAS
jgi:hypothetical protein